LNDMKVRPDKQMDIYYKMLNKPPYKPYVEKEKLDVLIWSKDRACQLDLLLRSIKDNFLNYNKIFVRYDYSTPEFQKGYEKVMKKDYKLPIEYIKKESFEKDTKEIINNKFTTTHILNLCDDDIFIRLTNVTSIIKKLDKNTCAISLRMSKDITYCYGTQKPCSLPQFKPCAKFLKWEWAKSDPATDWGYPSAVNIHIYKTDWFRKAIKNLSFDTPNKLEYLFNTNRTLFKSDIVSFQKTHILNIPVNQVQTLCPTNPFGKKYAYTKEELNKKWLEGKVIDTSNIYNYNNKGVNEEIELRFIGESK